MALDPTVADRLEKLKTAAEAVAWANRAADPYSDPTLLTLVIVGLVATGFAFRELYYMMAALRRPHEGGKDRTISYATSFFALILVGMTLEVYATHEYRTLMDFKTWKSTSDFGPKLKVACADVIAEESKLNAKDLTDSQTALIQQNCDPFFNFGSEDGSRK